MGGRQAVRLTVQAARLALYGHTALWRRLATLARSTDDRCRSDPRPCKHGGSLTGVSRKKP